MGDPGPPAPVVPSGGPPSGDSRLTWLGALAALALAAFAYRTLWSWDPATHELPPLEGWIFLASERPPQAVFALAAFLLAMRRGALLAALARPPVRLVGLLAATCGVGLLAVARWQASPELGLVSSLPLAIGLGLLIGGWTLARQLALPVGLLLLALPLPAALYHPLVHALQRGTTRYAAAALEVLGIPAVRDGEVITLPSGSFMVIETCSGLGSITTLTLLAIFWAGLGRVGLFHGVLLAAGAPAIAFALNGIRVVTLILTPGSEAAGYHALQGVLLFSVGVVGVWLWDRTLWRLRRERRPEAVTPDPAGGGAARRAVWVAAAGLALAAVASAAPPVRPAAPPEVPWSMALPAELLGAPAQPQPVDNRHLGSLRFAWSQHMGYGDPRDRVSVFVASEQPGNPRDLVVSPKNRVPGRGYEVESRLGQALGPDLLLGEEIVAAFEARRVLSWLLYAGVASPAREAVAGALGLPAPALGTTNQGRVLRITTPLDWSPGAGERAERRLAATLRILGPGFVKYR